MFWEIHKQKVVHNNVVIEEILTTNAADHLFTSDRITGVHDHVEGLSVIVPHRRVFNITIIDRAITFDPQLSVEIIFIRHEGLVVRDSVQREVAVEALAGGGAGEALVAVVGRHADVSAVVVLVEVPGPLFVCEALALVARAAYPVA